MHQLHGRLQLQLQENGAVFSLVRYLDVLDKHATASGVRVGDYSSSPQSHRAGSTASSGEAPDSAIDVTEDTMTYYAVVKTPAHSRSVSDPIPEIDELLYELVELPAGAAGRAPTPPPKAARRNSGLSSPACSPLERPITPQIPERKRPFSPIGQRPFSPTDSSLYDEGAPSPTVPYGKLDVPGRLSSLRTMSSATGNAFHRSAAMAGTVTTRISADNASITSRNGGGRVGRLFGHMRNALSETATPPPAIEAGSSSTLEVRRTPGSGGAPSIMTAAAFGRPGGLLRRGGQVLTSRVKKLPLFRIDDVTADMDATLEPDQIFGVSLHKSMQVSHSGARTHHSGGGSKKSGGGGGGSSRRDFPTCMLKCTSFIRESGGVQTPDIFGEAGHPARLAKLTDLFATGPDYGEDLDMAAAGFTAHEAADLMLLFLASLPKPLVAESVAKRWIAMSRQAIQSGSHAKRHLEECIDFWEEALGGVRGSARSLFKLLLNLWGDVADASEANDMTAERLAGRVLKPLLHTAPGRYETDLVLGLAFLIRKRSEYSAMLRGEGRPSKAAFKGGEEW